jgi:hypothetical protein
MRFGKTFEMMEEYYFVISKMGFNKTNTGGSGDDKFRLSFYW